MRKYKNKRIIKTPIVEERVILINRIIRECLNESFDSIIETDFEVIKEGDIIIYRFKTNQGNYYDLEFITSLINCETSIGDGVLSDFIKPFNEDNLCLILTTDIAFVPSEINVEDIDNHELYTKETNKNEPLELMGRISFLIKQFINLNKGRKVFVVGKDTNKIKLKIYLNMFDNIFSNDYIKLEGENSGYNNGCYYFIKK